MIRQDEPTFVLRGQDRFMPEVLEFWASLVERSVHNTISDTASNSRKKAKQARALAHTVRAWQVMNHTKTPD